MLSLKCLTQESEYSNLATHFYTSREVIRAVSVSGNPIELVGQVLYQDDDPNDPNVSAARIYVKGVVEVFTENGIIYEIDVDTNNSLGTFVTPYKTVLAEDLGANLTDNIVTVDSTLGWPELNGKFRIEDEIISYTDKTVTQFLDVPVQLLQQSMLLMMQDKKCLLRLKSTETRILTTLRSN